MTTLDTYAQAYFDTTQKSGGVTMSHLRFGKPNNLAYLITEPQFVACHRQSYVHEIRLDPRYQKGGTYLVELCGYPEEVKRHLPAKLRRQIAEKRI